MPICNLAFDTQKIMRLDVYLAQNALTKSRSRAVELISSGCVTVGGVTITKPSYNVDESFDVRVTESESSFVGRGGIKLEGALKKFNINAERKICADIGASTGGFTDCLLRRGAAHVYSIDSGHDQLARELREDDRVTNIEGFNARFLTQDTLPEKCDIVVSDLSFISQRLVIPAVKNIVKDGAVYILLIKPQFECGRAAVGKGGIVKDKKQHETAVRNVILCAAENGFAPRGIMKSPIKGGDGNTEFLFSSIFGGTGNITEKDIAEVVYE